MTQAHRFLRVICLLFTLLPPTANAGINITLDPWLKINPWPYGMPVLPYAHAMSTDGQPVNLTLRSDPAPFDAYQPGHYQLTFVAQGSQGTILQPLDIVVAQLELPPASWQGVFKLAASQPLPPPTQLAAAATAALLTPGIAVIIRTTTSNEQHLVTYSARNASTPSRWVALKPSIDMNVLDQALNHDRTAKHAKPGHGMVYLVAMGGSAILICLLAVTYVCWRRRQLQRTFVYDQTMPADLFARRSSTDFVPISSVNGRDRPSTRPSPLDEAALLASLFKFHDHRPLQPPEIVV